MKDGLFARLQGREVFVLPTNGGEWYEGNRRFCAFADMNCRAQSLRGTEKDLELTTGSRTLHICETVKLGRIVADARGRHDTAAQSSFSHI